MGILLLRGKTAESILTMLQKTNEFECPQMPTGKFLVNEVQEKRGESEKLVELLIHYLG